MQRTSGRSFVAFATLALASLAASAQWPPGSYDPSWGHSGRVFVNLGVPADFQLVGSIRQPDGKLLVGGNAALTARCGGIAFARFTLEGALDTDFGTGGWYKIVPSEYCNSPTTLHAMAAPSYRQEVGFVGRDDGYFFSALLFVGGPPAYSWTRDYQITSFTARGMAANPSGYEYLVAGYDNREPVGTPGRTTAFVRIAGNGAVDMSFGVNGVLKRAFGTQTDEAAAVGFNYDGSWFFASTARDTGSEMGSDIVVGRFRADGTLDTSWGSGGTRVVDFYGRDDAALALAVEPNMHVRVGGSAGSPSGRLPALAQLRADTGELDMSFGWGGKRTLFTPSNLDSEVCALLDTATSHAAAGTAIDRATGARSLLVYRHDGGGNPLWGFGDQGLALVAGQANPIGFFSDDPYGRTLLVAGNSATGATASVTKFGLEGFDSAYGARAFGIASSAFSVNEGGSMAMRPDGSMVLAGQIGRGGSYERLGGVVRLDANGARDTTFGVANGVAYLVPPAGTLSFFPRAIGMYEDGRVVVASTGQNTMDGMGVTFIARLGASGSRDPQWSAGGEVVLSGQAGLSEVGAVAVQPDGAVLVAGRGAGGDGSERITILRFLPDGMVDYSFGYYGRVVWTGETNQPQSAQGLMLDSDGRIFVAARANGPAGNSLFAVLRLLPNGAPDPSWGMGGAAYGPQGAAFAIARQADGKIVAGGDCGAYGESSCIVRFLASGQLDASFANNGVSLAQLGSSYNGFVGVAIQADGKIVAGGDGYAFTLARLHPDGSTDMSFNGGHVYSLENAQARSFAMTAEGRLVVSGRSLATGDLAVVRHFGGGDDSPDPFQFPPANGVAPGTLVTSLAVTPTGYDSATPVYVSNGEVATGDCQTWHPSWYIQPGEALCVRHTSAGEPGASATSTVTIGGTSATFTSTSAALDTTITQLQRSSPSPLQVIFFTSNAATATFECRLDGSPFSPCTNPATIQGVPDGTHTFSVRAVSGASVDATPASATFVLDATAPDTTITAGPTGSTNVSLWAFAFASDDPEATFECSVAGPPFFACVSPKEIAFGDGTYTFAVRAVDAAGNRDPSPAFRTFTIDRRPPETSIDAGQGPTGVVSDSTASFTYRSDEDASTFECRLDGAAFAACAGATNYTGLAQGSHTFEVRAIDAAGNFDATPAARTWTVDTLPPNTTFISAPSGTVASTSATLAFESVDGGSFFMCSLDGAAFAGCPSPVSLTGLAQGTHTFRVYAADAAGNVDATPASASWTVDATAPDTLITSAPMGTVGSTSATIVFTSEAGALFECRLDGAAFLACASPQSLSGLAQGAHTFQVRARDASGNVDASPASATWSIDTIAPQTTITSGPSGTVVSSSATVVFSADDPAATFQCSLDAGGYVACTSPAALAGLAEGSHAFEVRAVDAYGNVDASAAMIAWSVDTTAADAFITSAPVGSVASTTATISFTSEAGAAFECSLDAGAYAACTSPRSLTGLAQGSHTFRVRARDAWGNLDPTPASATWIVDTVAPDTTITGGPTGNNNPSTATFTFTANEPGATFECRRDGAAFAACASGITYSGLAKGNHTFDVRARDAAGNLDASPATRAWKTN